MPDVSKTIDRSMAISRNVAGVLSRRVKDATADYATRVRATHTAYAPPGFPLAHPQPWWTDWATYWIDASQRSALFWDTIRERGNQWIACEAAGKPPLLHYRWEVIADAHAYERPCNHAPVRIVPPRGVKVDERKRPFIIIGPRAGHGPGIGGFKEDSEVGVALNAGHPVYFVIFYPDPERRSAARRASIRARCPRFARCWTTSTVAGFPRRSCTAAFSSPPGARPGRRGEPQARREAQPEAAPSAGRTTARAAR